jgi:hypothetical protein
MIFWIVVSSTIFVLTLALGNHFNAKRARENKLKKIAKRLEQIEQNEKVKADKESDRG